MRNWHVAALCLVVALISAGMGFWFGFRQAWTLGAMVDAVPRGAVGIQLMQRIKAGETSDATYYFESQIDSGLMFWHDVKNSPLYPFLNQLSGSDVTPGTDKSVRHLAVFRKRNPSPLWDPVAMARVDFNIASADPEFAKELAASSRDAKAAMDSVIAEYAE